MLAEELPSLWKNRYKLERLTLRKTEEVITKTCGYWGIKFEKNLVNKITEDIEEHGMCFPPDIQIVYYSLLDALNRDELLITEKLYKNLGGAENIIENYFEKLLDEFQPDEKNIIMEILKNMITGSNTKNMLTLNEIASKVEHGIDVEKMIKKLVEKTIVRYLPEDDKYELIHDVLVKKIEEMLTENEKEMKITRYSLDLAMNSQKQDESSLISMDRLSGIYKFLNRMNLTKEEVDLILKSSIEHISDPHWHVRKNIVDALSIMKDKRCVEPLVKLLNKEVVTDVKQAIVTALGKIGDKRAVNPIIDKLDDENMYVRVDAIKALGKIGDKRAADPLIETLSGFEYWNVKKAAAIALGNIGGTNAIHALKNRVGDSEEDDDVKKAAISALNMVSKSVSLKNDKDTQIPEPRLKRKITLILPLTNRVMGYTFYYVAKDKGYYDEKGLGVDITYTEGGAMKPVEILTAEKTQLGQSTGDTVIVGRTKSASVVSIYQIAQNNSFCIISKSEKNITTLEDLVGRKVAFTSLDAPSYIGFRLILHKAGVDHRKIECIECGKNFINCLLEDKVDAGGYHLAQRVLLDRRGIGIRVNYVSDYVNLVPECIVVDEKMIQEDPELIKNFINATDKGLRYAIEHPDEAIDSFTRFNPEKSKERDFYLDSWKEFVCTAVLNDVVKRYGLGWSSEKQWIESQDILYEIGIINTKTDIKKMFTNQFITQS